MPLISIGSGEAGHDGLLAMLRRRAKAVGYSVVAERTGLARESLYRTLGKGGNPRLDTLALLCRVLSVNLVVRKARR